MFTLHKSFLCTVFFISLLAVTSGCAQLPSRKTDDMSNYSYVPATSASVGFEDPGIEAF